MKLLSDTVLILCNIYFIFNVLGIETIICSSTLTRDTFLGNLAINFAEEHNYLLIDMPNWMRILNCYDVYVNVNLFLLTIYVILTNSWLKYKSILLLGSGGIIFSRLYYCVLLYQYPKQPSYELAFFASEIPYDIGLALLLYKTLTATHKLEQPNILII